MSELMDGNMDDGGAKTLNTIAQANRFNEWMYETIKPFCKGRILEIGSGIGNISSFFIRDGQSIMLSDIRPAYCNYLRKHFSGKPGCEGVTNLDLVHPQFDQVHAGLLNTFDTVFALNVVEHIRDHELAISNAAKLLRPGGGMVILVPAHQWLYNGFDKELEHYRRYTRMRLKALMSPHVNISHSQYFNGAGIPGWFISGRILKRKIIPAGQMKLFNTLVPAFRLLDKLINNSIGLSVITVGTRP